MRGILFYFNNYNTFGHATRVFSLVKILKERLGDNARITVVETGIEQTQAIPFQKYADFHFIPLPYNKYNNYFDGDLHKKHLASFKKMIDNTKPEVFITDYYPFSRHFAYLGFLHILEYLKNRYKSKIVCISPHLNLGRDTYKAIKEYYDSLLILFPEELSKYYALFFSPQEARMLGDIYKKFRHKISYTGFLIDIDKKTREEQAVKKGLHLGNRKLILVSRGGYNKFEHLILNSLLLAKKRPEWLFLVSLGPSIEENRFKKYKSLTDGLKNIRLKKLIYPDFDDYLKASDISINMAGYNTMARLLFFKKKSVVFPVRHTEQRFNAEILSYCLPCKVFANGNAGSAQLEKGISELLKARQGPNGIIKQEWFNGLTVSSDLIKGIL
ncbi:MAG: glycosyltransferase [Candidatus Omnitrophota bacterium]